MRPSLALLLALTLLWSSQALAQPPVCGEARDCDEVTKRAEGRSSKAAAGGALKQAPLVMSNAQLTARLLELERENTRLKALSVEASEVSGESSNTALGAVAFWLGFGGATVSWLAAGISLDAPAMALGGLLAFGPAVGMGWAAESGHWGAGLVGLALDVAVAALPWILISTLNIYRDDEGYIVIDP